MKITFVSPFATLNGGTRVMATYARLLEKRVHEVTVMSQPKPRPSFAGRIRGALGLRRGKQKIATPGEGLCSRTDIGSLEPRADPIMTEPLIYYFVLPSNDRPVGGTNVLLWLAEVLRVGGYTTVLLYKNDRYRYPFQNYGGEAVFHSDHGSVLIPRLRKRIWQWRKLRKFCNGPRNRAFSASPRDVFVVPEFMYSRCMRDLGPARYILAAQDVFAFTRAFLKDVKDLSPQYQSIDAILTTSAASYSAASMFLGRECHRLQLPVGNEQLSYKVEKKLQIAYMPRKRKEEAETVVAALRTRRGLIDVPIIPIAGVSNEERNRILSESLIFLSFSEKEGFGLPPAEAMATGCIVIGYTGVGGNEYFSKETGFPIEDSDILSFVKTVEEVVAQFKMSPEPLNRLRQYAADTIAKQYGEANARSIALEIWERIDEELKAC